MILQAWVSNFQFTQSAVIVVAFIGDLWRFGPLILIAGQHCRRFVLVYPWVWKVFMIIHTVS